MSPSIRPRVLLVDDEPAQLRLLSLFLMRQCSIVTAADARSAMRQLEQSQFDAVICDYAMPDRNGMWLLEHVRVKMPKAMRILFSGRELPMVREHIRSGVIQHFIPKPVSANALLTCLGLGTSAALP